MSSPFSLETNKGTEESIEAISRSLRWINRIDTRNEATNLDVKNITKDLQEEKTRLTEEYKHKTIMREIDNFVVNNPQRVQDALFAGLDARVDALNEIKSYVEEHFGYVEMPSLSKENISWLVADRVKKKQDGNFGPNEYESEPFASADLNGIGTEPKLPNEIV